MKKYIFLFFISSIVSIIAGAQSKVYTLREVIDIAIENNIVSKQADLQLDAARINHNQARLNRIPVVGGIVNYGLNQGRSIDPFTNAYVNQTINYSGYGINSNVILFNGLTQLQTIKQFQYAKDAAEMDLQQVKDNLTLNVILAYLQVLTNEDLVEVSRNQSDVTQKQVERLEILNREGAISPPQLYDMLGQLKENELAVVTNLANLQSARLTLTQVMNIPYDPQIRVERITMEELLNQSTLSAEEIFGEATRRMAIVKAAELRKKSAEAGIKAVRGELFPTVVLSGNLNTNYSSIATRDILENTMELPSNDYVLVNGAKTPVIRNVNRFNTFRIGYFDQLENNVFSNINVGVRIPIFNSFQVRNRIRLAKIELKSVELDQQSINLQLRQEVDQAHVNMNNAWERYKVSREQVAAYAESFRAAEIRFNAGVGNSIDYLIAKNNLDRANATLVIAQYDYILRKKVLEFYQTNRF
jgi:outer membrane protein